MKDEDRRMDETDEGEEEEKGIVWSATDRPTYKMDAHDFFISSMANDLVLRNWLLARFSLYVYVRRKKEGGNGR